MNISAILCLVVFPFSATSNPAFQAHELSKDEAIRRAEAAIVRNGCTDLAPLKNRPKLSSDQPGVDFKFLWQHRLHCRAIRAGEGQVSGKPSWIIGFSVRQNYPEMFMDSRERLILMNRDGKNLRLENRKKRIKRILEDMH